MMKQLIQIFNDKTKGNWNLQNEYIIAASVFLFSLAVFIVYQGVVFSSQNVAINTNLTLFFISIFPIFCAFRLFIVYKAKPIPYFGALTGTIDILLLSAIILMFSQQYGLAAATLKSPSFVFYFVLIALHAMRFKPKLILINGGLSVITWTVIVIALGQSSPEITHNYIDYINSSSLLIGAEIEKLFALSVFTLALALGARRARVLHDQEKASQEKLSLVRLEEEQRISRLKSEFLNTMSHELRTPMNGVLGMVQTLRLTPLNNHQESMLEIIEKSGNHLTQILNNILDFSHISGEDMELINTPFNLTDLISRACIKTEKIAHRKNITFKSEIHPATPMHLMGDEQRLLQILEHLLDNAVKFTHEGLIRLFVHGAQKENICELNFEIHDTGIGIDGADFESIFKPFHQVDGSTTREYGGVGMGLALCKRLVSIMKGKMNVQSILGFGSVFTVVISFPIAIQGGNEKKETAILENKPPDNERAA